MTPIQVSIALLLLHSAHAAPTEISLHNESSSLASSVVGNWTLICEDLCSLNLSGPACGLDCSKVPAREELNSAVRPFANLTDGARDDFCESLCESGLSERQCQCKRVPIAAVSLSAKASFKPDRLKICHDICRHQRVTLRSCPKCIYEEQARFERFLMAFDVAPGASLPSPPTPPPRPPHNHLPPLPTPSSEQQPQQFQNIPRPFVFRPNFQMERIPPQTTTEPTTPNWNQLCVQLCRNGSGGILCNCDLPPF